jgi:hypothetical protein
LSCYDFQLFLTHLEGWHEARREDWKQTAFLGSVLINLWSKRKTSVDELLGETTEEAPPLLDKNAFDAYMRKRIADATEAEAQEDDQPW